MHHQSNTTTHSGSFTLQQLGESEEIKHICNQIEQVAPTDCAVLLVGETGTGKSTFARCVFEASKRANKPLVYMNCATPPETSIEAELFGHHKKTIIGHSDTNLDYLIPINGATVFIDEISELSADGQANLLETLELVENHNSLGGKPAIDIRAIVTSQHDLGELVQQEKFNKRLFFHLNIFTIHIPPLRDRSSDKLLIAEKLLATAADKYGKGKKYFSPTAIQEINAYHWPGNYRELRNTIERAVILSQTDAITKDMLSLDPNTFMNDVVEPGLAPANGTVTMLQDNRAEDLSLEDYFRHFVLEHQDQLTETELAQKLGISRKCLWERRNKFGLPRLKAQQKTIAG